MRNVLRFRQGDLPWGPYPLGNSGLTVSSHGCYSTVVSCGLASHFYKDVDPGDFVEYMNEIGGYDKWGQIIWGKVTEMFPDVKLVKAAWSENAPFANTVFGKLSAEKCVADIQRANNLGQIVGICVDLNEFNSTKPDHIVLAVETPDDHENWYIMDPAFGDVVKFRDRYGPVLDNIYGYRIIAGTPANFPDTANSSDIKAGIAVGQCVDDRYGKNDILHQLLSA